MAKRHRGPWPDWEPTTDRQRAILADVLTAYEQHYRDGTLRRGGRGIFYDLRPYGHGNGMTYRKPDSQNPVTMKDPVTGKRIQLFGEMEAHPEAVQEIVLLARRAGMIPEDWVADTRAPEPEGRNFDRTPEGTADLIASMVADAAKDFDLNPQRMQPVHVEILCEAEDLMPRIARIAGPLGVDVYSGAGYGGLKGKRAFAERARERGKPTVVLNISDRDRHGDQIYTAAAEDSVAWAGGRGAVFPLDWYHEPRDLVALRRTLIANDTRGAIIFVRLALTIRQAEGLGLLDADDKAEVDGVPVRTMDRWVTEAIEALGTRHGRKRHLVDLRRQRERLPGLLREALRED